MNEMAQLYMATIKTPKLDSLETYTHFSWVYYQLGCVLSFPMCYSV